MRYTNLLLFFILVIMTFGFRTPESPVIYLIGDSTMAEKPLHDNPEQGWGMYLREFVKDDFAIENHAKNGRSTKSFLAQGLWKAVLEKLKRGDYVIIQFGHNDSKLSDSTRYAAPWGAYKENLERFIDETRTAGAVPILVTPLNRRKFSEAGEFIDQHGEYPAVVRDVARRKNVFLIDAHKQSLELLSRIGPKKSRELFLFIPPNLFGIMKKGREDNTHFSKYGARVFAGMIAGELRNEPGLIKDAIKNLSSPPSFSRSACWGYDFIVSKNGDGDFTSIQEAINAVPRNTNRFYTIFIRNGIYREKLFVEKNNIRLVGENRDSTKIVFAELRKNWRRNHVDDYGAGVLNIKNNVCGLIVSSLTIHNDYGGLNGDNDHQFAIRGGGTKIILIDCSVVADGGDAVSLWNGKDGMYFHRNCYFEGYVDFVCPRGWCFIDSSRFFGRNLTASIWMDGDMDNTQKFVIKDSYFDGVAGFPLGRHHREAAFYLLFCRFSKNMADKPIQYVGPGSPKWPGRYFYYHCSGENGNYSWFADNFADNPEGLAPDAITPLKVFSGKWDPEGVLLRINDN